MRQAHPKNRTRHRFAAVGLGFAMFATGSLTLRVLATDRSSSDAPRVVAAAVAPADRPATAPTIRVAASIPPFDSAARLHAASHSATTGNVSRPEVVVPEAAAREVPRASAGSRVVVLGDSYTTGWNGAGLGSRNWTTIVGHNRGWTIVNLAVAGTGFMNPGWTHQPVGSLIAKTVGQRPDVEIVATGHNDSRWSAATTSQEAERVIARLRASLPDAVLVIVAPIWQNGSAPVRCLVLRDHLRRAAAAVGAIFVDPLAEGWFSGADHQFIGPDGFHPTDAGHRHMATVILADLADRLSD